MYVHRYHPYFKLIYNFVHFLSIKKNLKGKITNGFSDVSILQTYPSAPLFAKIQTAINIDHRHHDQWNLIRLSKPRTVLTIPIQVLEYTILQNKRMRWCGVAHQ